MSSRNIKNIKLDEVIGFVGGENVAVNRFGKFNQDYILFESERTGENDKRKCVSQIVFEMKDGKERQAAIVQMVTDLKNADPETWGLAQTINTQGQLTPAKVWATQGGYLLHSGARRWLSRTLLHAQMPTNHPSEYWVEVAEETDATNAKVTMMLTNLHKPMNYTTLAKRVHEFKSATDWSDKQIADQLGLMHKDKHGQVRPDTLLVGKLRKLYTGAEPKELMALDAGTARLHTILKKIEKRKGNPGEAGEEQGDGKGKGGRKKIHMKPKQLEELYSNPDELRSIMGDKEGKDPVEILRWFIATKLLGKKYSPKKVPA